MSRKALLTLPLLLTLSACAGVNSGSASAESTVTETSSASSSSLSGSVQLFAAASLGKVGDELIEAFKAENPNVEVIPTYAGSSKLVTQISEGAQPDLLITADSATMDKGLALEELAGASPEIIATNALVLATAPGNPAKIDDIGDLAAAGVTTAVCAAEVPCGRLANGELERTGVTPSAKTEEANVSAVATKVAEGQADAGFIYSTDATALKADKDISVVELPEVERNNYPLALTKTGQQNQAAQSFAKWLAESEKASEILVKYGFQAA